MMPAGGYQRPTSPAPTSGPGSLSQRTDGGPGSKQAARYVAGMPYGEGADFMDIQSMAPMEAGAPTPSAAGAAQDVRRTMETAPVTPLSAPSTRMGEPVTAGAELGAGPGVEALGLSGPSQTEQDAAKARIAAYRPVLVYLASRPDTSPDTRMFIRQLIGE